MANGPRGAEIVNNFSMISRPYIPVLFLLFFFLPPLPADAQADAPAATSEEEKEVAREFFKQGVSLFEDKDYAKALENFEQAFAIVPHWSSRFNIGMCYYYIGDHARALAELLAFQEEAGEEAPEDMATEVAQVIETAQSKIAVISFTGVSGNADVEVDGQEPVTSPDGVEIFVAPGVHHFRVVDEGKVLLDDNITAKANQTKEIMVYVKPEEELEEEGPSPPHPKREVNAFKAAGWSLIGLAGASLIVGAVTGGLVIAKKHKIEDLEKQYHDAPADEQDAIMEEAADHYDQGVVLGDTSTAFFVIGALAAAGGAALLVLDTKREKKSGAAASLSMGLAPSGIFLTCAF
jgi:tetratricopeptide (TPR) repeat protein